MDRTLSVQLAVVFGFLCFIMLSIKLINFLKTKKRNTELWGTIFSGLTQNAVDLEPLKEPEAFVEKKARKNGRNSDPQKFYKN